VIIILSGKELNNYLIINFLLIDFVYLVNIKIYLTILTYTKDYYFLNIFNSVYILKHKAINILLFYFNDYGLLHYFSINIHYIL